MRAEPHNKSMPAICAGIMVLAALSMILAGTSAAEGDEAGILIRLDYNNRTIFDTNNDGVENTTGVVDFTVCGSSIAAGLDAGNLAVIWSAYSNETKKRWMRCYGSESTCGIIGYEASMPRWNDTYYLYFGRDGAGHLNTVSAVIYYYDPDGQAFFESGVAELRAVFTGIEGLSFARSVQCDGCNSSVPEDAVVNMTIRLSNAEGRVMTEFYPADWLVIDAPGASMDRHNETHNKLAWMMNGSVSYLIKSPGPGAYAFVSVVGSESAESTINVSATAPAEDPAGIIQGRRDFRTDDAPSFVFRPRRLTFGEELRSVFGAFSRVEETIDVRVSDADGKTSDLFPTVMRTGDGYEITIPQDRHFTPGLYRLEINYTRDGESTLITQDFTWGVLALNTHKSIYRPFEAAEAGMAVLDDHGRMVCDADVTLVITDPFGGTVVLSTSNGLIHISPECEIYGYTAKPDYYGNFTPVAEGEHVMNLTAVTRNGARSIVDRIYVQEEIDFDVVRRGPTRIFPAGPYLMNITITADADFTGMVTEYVPSLFQIAPGEMITETSGDTTALSWPVHLTAGEIRGISYYFTAPGISPQFYLSGPLKIGGWNERRFWQIASDSVCTSNTLNAPAAPLAMLVGGSYGSMQCTVVAGGNPSWNQHAQFTTGGAYVDFKATGNISTDSANPVSHSGGGTIVDTWILDAEKPGTYTVQCYAEGQITCTSLPQTITVADPKPMWNSNATSIPSSFLKRRSYFNITWTDSAAGGFGGVGTVYFETNLTGSPLNWTMNRISGTATSGKYNFSRLYPVGSYYWKSWANDTFSQWNQSSRWVFAIARATPNMTLKLNGTAGNITIDEDNHIWLNASLVAGDSQRIQLYSNGTLISNRTSPLSNYTQYADPGMYNITVRYKESGNYTGLQMAYFLNVSDTTPPNMTLLLPENRTYDADGNINFTYLVDDFSSVVQCELLFSGSQVRQNTSINKDISQRFAYDNLAEDAAAYEWKINCTDSMGYEGNSTTRYVTVDKTNPAVGLVSPGHGSWDTDGTVQMSYKPKDNNLDSCVLWGNFSGTWKKNQTEDNPSSGAANSFAAVSLQDGTYKWNVWCNDSAKRWAWNSTNYTLYVDRSKPRINLTNPTPGNNTNQTNSTIIVNVTHAEANPDTLVLAWNGTNESYPYAGGYTNITKSGLSDGLYTFYVWANDSSAQTNRTEARTVRVDSTPPYLYLNNPQNGYWSRAYSVAYKYNVTDNLMGVKNCSLVIDGKINMSNASIVEGKSLNFTVLMPNGVGYVWNINCSDKLNNTNNSQSRTLGIDTTYPSIASEGVNETSFDINEYACLNVSVADTFSGVYRVTAQLYISGVGLRNYSLTNSTNGCGNSGGSVWTNLTRLIYEGNYSWNRTFARDVAGNRNATDPPVITWNVSTVVFINATLLEPSGSIELNVSTLSMNSTFDVGCNVTCREESSLNCTDVTLALEYYDAEWLDLLSSAGPLINEYDSQDCGNITIGSYCSKTFNVTVGTGAGGENYDIRCQAVSSNAPTDESRNFTLTVNGYPAASFTYPLNGSYLRGNETLNASASSDDQEIAAYLFELDNTTAFSTPDLLCSGADDNCTLNTVSQTQCSQNSFYCYVRLNVTDNDGLKNTTTITIQIDNTGPVVMLNTPEDGGWRSSSAVFRYTGYDANLDACTLYHNATGWKANQTNTSAHNANPGKFTVALPDGSYAWNVLCNDSAGNSAFNATNFTLNIDTAKPVISYSNNTEKTGTFFNRSWIFVNVSAADDNEANITFTLRNQSAGVNSTTYTTAARSINFTGLASNKAYFYNVTITDLAGNKNTTAKRNITLDSLLPGVKFGSATAQSGSFYNRSWVYVNVTVTEANFRNITFYLYNTTGEVNQTTYSARVYYRNFTGLNSNMLYTYNATVRDLTGFSNSTPTRNLTLDSLPPLVRLEQPPNSALLNHDAIRFNFTPSDANIKNCSLFANFSGAFMKNETLTALANGSKNSFNAVTLGTGTYAWNVRCYDWAGNSRFNDSNYTVEIDVTAPAAFSLSGPSNDTVSMTLAPTLTWTETSDTNFANYTIQMASNIDFTPVDFQNATVGNISNTTYRLPAPLDANLKYYWRIIAYDTLGQGTESDQVFVYTTDTVKPSVRLQSPSDDQLITASNAVTFYYNVTDASDIVNCTLIWDSNTETETDIAKGTSQYILDVLGNGDHNWSINCTDEAGNTNGSQ
ncbi:MAG: hypothetical protein ABH879_07225, partial [archaeon]